MDSGNSGSIQSSSDGGDDHNQEYNSCAADSISTYFNHPTPPPSQPPPHHNRHNSTLSFDPISSLLNFDPIFQRSDPNYTQTNPIFRLPTSPPLCFPENNTDTVKTTTTQRADHYALGARANPNKKKRSRASRRAPTTVLTTDATNFRAMVQEFTGIPPPPFSSSSSPFVRSSGLDLFGTPSSMIRSNPYDLIRPTFAQKFQPPPFLSGTFCSTSGTAFINDFQMQQNTIPSAGDMSSQLRMGVLDEFGLGRHGPSNERIQMGWADGAAGVGPNGADQSHLRLVNGTYHEYSHDGSTGNNSSSIGNLVNFTTSSSDFRGGKGSETVCIRGERNPEPWICPSDH